MTVNPSRELVLEARALRKSVLQRGASRTLFDGLDLTVSSGEIVAVLGRSGSGKSSLLNILGALDSPDAGTVTVGGVPCTNLGRRSASRLRAKQIGFVFQAMNLIPHLTVATNIELGAWPSGARPSRDVLSTLLDELGITSLIDARASALSLGEQQRVAVARALVKSPAVVLADEPTGSLDLESENSVIAALRRAADRGSGVVVVTHSEVVAAQADRSLRLSDSGTLAESR